MRIRFSQSGSQSNRGRYPLSRVLPKECWQVGKSVARVPALRRHGSVKPFGEKRRILPGSFPEWARLKRQTEQAGREIQSGPMAFLQAVIEVETRSRFS